MDASFRLQFVICKRENGRRLSFCLSENKIMLLKDR